MSATGFSNSWRRWNGTGGNGGAGATGPTGPTGPTGATGPAPSGTGFLQVVSGVLQPPTPLSDSEVNTALGYTAADDADLAAEATLARNADNLTSGTIPAARLPGVLANVDTQAELLAAAAAQPAATGSPNGSKYLRDDNTWQAVTDSTKLPITGGTLSGNLVFSGANFVTGSAIGRNTYGHTEISSADVIHLSPTSQLYINKPAVINGTQTALANTLHGFWYDGSRVVYQSASGLIGFYGRLVTRSNSTAYSIVDCPAGDVARILLVDDAGKQAIAKVDAAQTVTFETGSHADYVASSSPASGEVGVYVTSNIVTLKPGSAGARKIAAFFNRGIA